MLICLMVILSMFMMYELTVLSLKDYFQCDAHLFAGNTKHVYDVQTNRFVWERWLTEFMKHSLNQNFSNSEARFGVCNFQFRCHSLFQAFPRLKHYDMQIPWTLRSSFIQRKWMPIKCIMRKLILRLLIIRMTEYYGFISREFKFIIKFMI